MAGDPSARPYESVCKLALRTSLLPVFSRWELRGGQRTQSRLKWMSSSAATEGTSALFANGRPPTVYRHDGFNQGCVI